MARQPKLKEKWTDECFSEIQKNDKIFYETERGQTHTGKAVMMGPMGWVIDIGHGIPKVVNEGYNYLGHCPGKKRSQDWLGKFLNQNDTEWNGK